VAVGGALTVEGTPSAPAGTTRSDPGRSERLAGAVLMGGSVLAALVVAAFPGPNPIDRWGFDAVSPSAGSALLIRITDLGDPAVLVVGALAAALVVGGRDRVRALACVAGPLLAAVLVELVFKPLVRRHFEGVLSYPSGTVADIAALATAWALAVPRRARPAVVAVGTVVTVAMVVAVTGLRWHYPTDALGGAVLGVGTVLLVDGMLHHPRVSGRRPPAR
jgi:membrane-associated phospholipid phosphatase